MSATNQTIGEAEIFDFGGEIVWRPSQEIIERSRLKRFMDRYGLASFQELHRRSISDPEWFCAVSSGHAFIMGIDGPRMYLICRHCFHETSGWELGGRPPRVTS